MTEDPRELPVPEGANLLKRVEIFARDLAYGCNVGDWESSFTYYGGGMNVWTSLVNDPLSEQNSRRLETYRKNKWNNHHPTANDLSIFEYVVTDGNAYSLTKQAFDLLKQPATPATVFISYRRKESSAFALLVEARLIMVGAAPPHIDKNLKGGEPWRARLQERVESSEYLVCLIGPTTLESDNVKKEIQWAADSNRLIIPVCHNGQTLKACERVLPQLTASNGHEIKGDPEDHSAADYEAAVNFILNSMGYRTF